MKKTIPYAEGLEKRKLEELFRLIKQGNIEKIKDLLNTNLELFDKSDHYGYTVLHQAAASRQKGIVELLLESKPNLVHTVNIVGVNPLSMASSYGYEEIIELFLKFDPKLAEAFNHLGQTALHLAGFSSQTGAIKMLLNFKPELIDAVSNNGRTALHDAASNGNKKIVKLLLSYKPELVNVLDHEGRSPLQLVSKHSHQEIIKILQGAQDALNFTGKYCKEEPFEHKGDYPYPDKDLSISPAPHLPHSRKEGSDLAALAALKENMMRFEKMIAQQMIAQRDLPPPPYSSEDESAAADVLGDAGLHHK